MGKGAFSPFLIVFSTCFVNFLPFSSNLSSDPYSLEESKIWYLIKGLLSCSFLALLDDGQRAIVMTSCPSCVRPCMRL